LSCISFAGEETQRGGSILLKICKNKILKMAEKKKKFGLYFQKTLL
jgi:hypothetical protein